jgi:hypothetical protein
MREGGTVWSLEHADIYMYEISSGLEAPICVHEAAQASSDIWGNVVVWEDCRNDPEHTNEPSQCSKDLYMYDLDTEEEIRLVNMGNGGGPQIVENNVYFLMDDDSGVFSVFKVTIE